MNRNKIACHCRNITYGKIEDAVKAGAYTYNEVQERTKCGLGCKRCKELIEIIIRDVIEENHIIVNE